MTPENAAPPTDPTPFTAPARAVRLVAKQPLTDAERHAAREARRQEKAAAAAAKPVERPFLERKLAGLHDAQDILRVLDSELVIQRSIRQAGEGGKSRQAVRVLSVCVLFILLIAALAAVGWLQSRLAESGFSHHRAEIRARR